MANELAKIDGPEIIESAVETVKPVVHGSSILDMPPDAFQAGLDRRRLNHKALIRWVAQALVEGTDYGKIHVVKKETCDKGKWCKNENHFSKPVLFKPGSEKIAGMLGVIPTFPTLKDYEAAAVNGVKIETIVLRCELQDASGRVLAEGVGARSVSKDYGDINKSFKMAEKSGQIDATLRLGGLSEVFTQDLEDMIAQAEIIAPEPPQVVWKPSPPGDKFVGEGLNVLVDDDPSVEEIQLRKSLGEHPEPARLAGTVAPGHCTLKGCGGEIELYVSESKLYPGREYWQCASAHEEKIRLLNEGATNKLANAAVAAHYREWAGPVERLEAEPPSIFDKISKDIAEKIEAGA